MHNYIPELEEQYRKGKINRREFIRLATLLGVSAGAATFMAACTPKEEPTPTALPVVDPTATPVPAEPTKPAGPRRGGELIAINQLFEMTDPATCGAQQDNVYRNVAEFLTVTNAANITIPWLLERWTPSDDLKTWTLFLRQGITFNHGPEMTADDVVFNFQRWLDPDTGSSTLGLMGGYLSAANVEKVDDYTVKLHLDKPQIAVPEHLNHYNNVILPKDFDGDWQANAVGTGPYTLEEFLPQERAVLKRREGYWRNGADGEALPYLDSIRFLALTEPSAIMSALATGEIDIAEIQAAQMEGLQGSADVEFAAQLSSFAHVIRMRADQGTFADVNLRNAVKACLDRDLFVESVTRGFGAVAGDHHVSPIHPEYCPMDAPVQDIAKAKELVAAAGYGNGVEVEMAVMNNEPFLTMAQMVKQQCEPAGITVNLNVMPDNLYWEQWTDVEFGITNWGHRPLGVMVLSLAYRSGADWNETHYSNAEFDRLIEEAEGTYEVEARRDLMCQIQTIMQEDGPVAIPHWTPSIFAHRKRVKGYQAAPITVLMLEETWLDQEA